MITLTGCVGKCAGWWWEILEWGTSASCTSSMDPVPSSRSSLLHVVDIWLCQAANFDRFPCPVCGDACWVPSHMVQIVGSRYFLFLSGCSKEQARRHSSDRAIDRFLHPQGLLHIQIWRRPTSRNLWHDAFGIERNAKSHRSTPLARRLW